MEKSVDIAIIGGGLAAFAAAIELKDSGKEVILISKAPGASALSSGAWDLADNPLKSKNEEWAILPSIQKNIEETIKRNEFHPYSVLSKSFSGNNFYSFFQKVIEKAVEEFPLPLSGSTERNMAVVTSLGTVKPTAFVQESMMDADLCKMDQAKVLVVGVQGFPPFNARFICQSLLEQQESQEKNHIQFAGQFEVEMPGEKSHSSLNAVELAQLLDRESTFVKFGQDIVRYIQHKVYSHLLLPPVLGVENTSAIIEALRKITGLKVSETLATPMSVPGWRLWEALQKYFQKRSISILEGEVVDFASEQHNIKSVRVHANDELMNVQARSYILASGKYIGGGMRRQGRFQETIFNLPVFAGDRELTTQSVLRESRPNAAESQPFLSAGIRINALTQPLNEDHQVAYDNLFAAGAILEGFDSSHQRCAAGVSLISGVVAGSNALQIAK